MSWTPKVKQATGPSAGNALPAPGADGTVLTAQGGAWVAQPSANTPINSLPILTNEAGAEDYVPIYDASAATTKRILVNDLMSA